MRSLLFHLALLTLAGPVAAQMTAVRVAFGVFVPTFVTGVPGDASRVLVLERDGTIRLLKNDVLQGVFLDLEGVVNWENPEQGLLGLAFHPDYESNGYFYVYYTGGTGAGVSVVERYTVSSDPDSADAGSAHTVFQLTQPHPSHNGAHVEFGPGGYLYLGLGDGAGTQVSAGRAQDPQSLFGKLLRIDVDSDDFPADSLRNYAIPPTNPFVGDPSTLDEIWALGLRNPYRFAFDPVTADLYLGDVGHFCWEEIDFQAAGSPGGENYGWRVREGDRCWDEENPFDCTPEIACDSAFTSPLYTRRHIPPGSCYSIVAGRVYRGSALPGLVGAFFFTDYCRGEVWTLRTDGTEVTELIEWTAVLDTPGAPAITNPSSVGENALGELYVTDWCCSAAGEVFKIVPDSTFVGVDEFPAGGPELRADPDPFRDRTRFTLRTEAGVPTTVSVYSAGGRLVVRRSLGPTPDGRLGWEWDGGDANGMPVAGGVYFVRAKTGSRTVARRVTVLR